MIHYLIGLLLGHPCPHGEMTERRHSTVAG